VNLYFFLEGRRTEPKVYRAWVKHVFPQLTEVGIISDVQQDNYLLKSGFGYPQLLNRVDEILADITGHGGIDHFFICLDAEEVLPEDRAREIEKLVSRRLSNTIHHIIIHNCCIETWFLGNSRVMKRNPQSERLRRFKEFYDVSVNCPELMGRPAGYRVKAHFHLDYLREMMIEKGLSYNKENPGEVQKRTYLAALAKRYDKTGHLESFGRLVAVWRTLGGGL
jgi:hypothetical protein